MGLASHFGGEQAAYQCKKCGHTMTLYAPRCPLCLNKTITQVKTEKSPEAFRAVTEAKEQASKPGPSVVPFAALAIVLALAAAAFTMFGQPRPESITRTDPSPKVGSTAKSRSSRMPVSNNHSSKRTKRSNAVTAKPRGGSTPGSSTPAPATPMKLWEASSDDEGESP